MNLKHIFPLIAIVGVILTVRDCRHVQVGFQRMKWPVADGTVTDATVVDGRLHRPRVTYHYAVDGVEYVAITDLKAPYFGAKSTRKEVAYKTIADHPKHSLVRVYYDPDNPMNSYLTPRPTWDEFTRMSLGVMLMLAGAGGILATRRPRESPQQ